MERLTYDCCVDGYHCWQVKGADNSECREVCENQKDSGCKNCPISKAFDRLAAIEDILGNNYDLDRLRELLEADREGRCVVLPCKVEDDVYINLLSRTLPFSVISISQLASTPTYKAMHGITLCYIFKADDVGKTVFLSREAAEAALKGEPDD